MKKVFLILNIIFCIISLTGCDVVNDWLEDFKNNIKTLSIENEELKNESDKYIFNFTLNEIDVYDGMIGIVDMKIQSYSKSLYNDTQTFDIEFIDETSLEYSFEILKNDIKDSYISTGEFSYTITINSKQYTSQLSITELTIGTLALSDLENCIYNSASTLARDNILANEWSNENEAKDIVNMLDMYDELTQIIIDFMIECDDLIVSEEDYLFLQYDVFDYKLLKTQVYEVLEAVIYDNPIFYFISKSSATNKYTTSDYIANLFLYVDEDYNDSDIRYNYNCLIVDYFNECTILIEYAETDLEKALLIHDKIINEVDYNYNFDGSCYNILGVVAKEGPVCESYSETYFMLLNFYDIPCYLVTGVAYVNNRSENHAWNLIQIDGLWYGVDLTWNDSGASKPISYTYFAAGSNNTLFTNSHIPGDNGLIIDDYIYYMIDLPELSATDLIYTW